MKKTVQVRQLTLGNGTPKICIPVTGETLEEIRAQLIPILKSPCDLVEWRIDFFRETEKEGWLEEALTILREELKDIALLATFRNKEEGGERSISLEEYEALCIAVMESGKADMVDVEINRGEERMKRIIDAVHAENGIVVGSFHDFAKTPSREELVTILSRMQELGADISKAAIMPECEQDVITLLEASLDMKLRYADRPFITMSMSRLGGVSRLAGGLTGSAVTFGTAGRASAPGQMEAEALARLLPML